MIIVVIIVNMYVNTVKMKNKSCDTEDKKRDEN